MKSINYEETSENNVQKLSDVFEEINRIRRKTDTSNYNNRDIASFNEENFFYKEKQVIKRKLKKLIAVDLIIMCTISFSVFANYIFAFSEEEFGAENVQAVAAVEFEANSGAIDLENVLLENVSILKTKELKDEAVEVEFETKYIEDQNLPKDEKIVDQQGKNGSKDVTVIKTYENQDLVDEVLIDEKITLEPVQEVVRVGTSEFLKVNKIHLGDTVYAVDTTNLNKQTSESSEVITSIPSSLEMKLTQMDGEWCKVKFNGMDGYVKSSKLTSAIATPTILEANRIQKLKLGANENMALNKSSGLTLNDFKKILSNNSRDKYGIFAEAAEDFYKADKNYNINGVLLASIGIHESAWGTSKIAKDKKNLFGYGAYDWSPYESAYSFETYYEGIEMLAKSLSKNYINVSGTVLPNGEIATGVYYNGNTVSGINVRYASDPDWHTKVWNYMNTLYNSL